MRIDGNTRIVGLFGYPVKHTLSPVFQNAAFQAKKLNYVYLPFEVAPQELELALRSLSTLGIAGINVTIPHKESVIPYLSGLSTEAQIIGAVNTISVINGKLIGCNTDGYGFVTSLKKDLNTELKGKKIMVLGAGGGARAVVLKALMEKAGKIYIGDVLEEKVVRLISDAKRIYPDSKVVPYYFKDSEIRDFLEDAEILINATPVGMKKEDPLLVKPEWMRDSLLVYDLIYNPFETKLLKAAKKRGCRCSNGLGMLLHQGAKSFEIWTGVKAPVEVMKKALQKAIRGVSYKP